MNTIRRVEGAAQLPHKRSNHSVLLDNSTTGDSSPVFDVDNSGASLRAFNVPFGVRILLEMVYSFNGREIVDVIRVNGIDLSLTRENNTLQITVPGKYRVRTEQPLGVLGDCAVILC